MAPWPGVSEFQFSYLCLLVVGVRLNQSIGRTQTKQTRYELDMAIHLQPLGVIIVQTVEQLLEYPCLTRSTLLLFLFYINSSQEYY